MPPPRAPSACADGPVLCSAADATSHLFFAYLRSLSPEQSPTGISLLPRSLEKLLRDTAYPPPTSRGIMTNTNKLVMMVDTVSPTPFALLRRAGHFQYRDSDAGLQQFSNYQDPIQALTEECRRVLKAISAANQSQASSVKHSTSLRDASWSRFEDMGFSTTLAEDEEESDDSAAAARPPPVLRRTPVPGNDLARPTTPSWADFLSSGFVDDNPVRPNVLLPPDKVLPPIETQIRQHSSQSHRPRLDSDRNLEPGELASITVIQLDDAFWWVWMSSLAPEETPDRKSAFGRCALIETRIPSARWIVMEEMIAGAAPEPQEGAYIAEKKRFFSWTKRGKTIARRKTTGKHGLDRDDKNGAGRGNGKGAVSNDTHARIQAKAAQLRALRDLEQQAAAQAASQRRGRNDSDLLAEKTNSVLTLQPHIAGEASSAMKWVKKYDKGAIKDAYLANSNAGRGVAVSPAPSVHTNGTSAANGSAAAGTNGHANVGPLAPHVPAKDPTPRPSMRSSHAEPEADEAVEPSSMPTPPPRDRDIVVAATPTSPEHSEGSPEMPMPSRGKLHANREKTGLRKLFARKTRASKVPDNAPTDLDEMMQQRGSTPEPPVEQTQTPTPAATPTRAETAQEPAIAGAPASPAAMPETPKTEHMADEGLSQVDSRDAAEANKEFSSFDQGPLAEQPAFVPDEDPKDAAPPATARRPPRQEPPAAAPAPTEGLSQSAGPGVQDRWAQIRKNAAQRAATRPKEEAGRGPPSRAGDADDDTSGEESRCRCVARSALPRADCCRSNRVPSRSHQGARCRAHGQHGGEHGPPGRGGPPLEALAIPAARRGSVDWPSLLSRSTTPQQARQPPRPRALAGCPFFDTQAHLLVMRIIASHLYGPPPFPPASIGCAFFSHLYDTTGRQTRPWEPAVGARPRRFGGVDVGARRAPWPCLSALPPPLAACCPVASCFFFFLPRPGQLSGCARVTRSEARTQSSCVCVCVCEALDLMCEALGLMCEAHNSMGSLCVCGEI